MKFQPHCYVLNLIRPVAEISEKGFRIGWIGSFTTSPYLLDILPAIRKFLVNQVNSELILIGFDKELLREEVSIPNIKMVEWSEDKEGEILDKIDVGILPSPDTPWERGKCGFKLVQYMAAGKPYIYTPLEANCKIDRNGNNLKAKTMDDWYEAFFEVLNNRNKYYEIGLTNRKIAWENYTIEGNFPIYLDLLQRVAKRKL